MQQQQLNEHPNRQAATGAPPLAADVQAHLGRQLKAVFAEIASQPVPDRFAQLLDDLERKHADAHPSGDTKKPAQDA
jgi:hypothetical protein